MKRAARILLVCLLLAIIWSVWIGWRITACGREQNPEAIADVAIVLGAGAPNGKPSPVFIARIDHALDLYRTGRARQILFTGGRGEDERIADSEAARVYALAQGIPSDAILVETSSRTTLENLREAKRLIAATPAKTCLLVSDPLHLFRAARMARDQGLVVTTSPASQTRIRGTRAKLVFLLREIWFYHVHLITRH